MKPTHWIWLSDAKSPVNWAILSYGPQLVVGATADTAEHLVTRHMLPGLSLQSLVRRFNDNKLIY